MTQSHNLTYSKSLQVYLYKWLNPDKKVIIVKRSNKTKKGYTYHSITTNECKRVLKPILTAL